MAYSNAFKTPLPKPGAIPAATSSFTVDHALLLPRFEAYRLIQEDPAVQGSQSSYHQTSQPLPSRPLGLKQSYDLGLEAFSSSGGGGGGGSAGGRTLGFKEAKERALHPFLVPARLSGSEAHAPVAGYVDSNGFIVLLSLASVGAGSGDGDQERSSLKAVGHPVHRLDLTSAPPEGYSRSLPSLVSLSSTRWLASDGNGTLNVVDIEQIEQPGGQRRWITKSTTTWAIDGGDDSLQLPFSLAAAETAGDGRVHVLVQTCRRESLAGGATRQRGGLGILSTTSAPAAGRTTSSRAVFDIRLLALDLDGLDGGNAGGPTQPRPAKVQWSVVGQEPLLYCRLDVASGQHLLGSESGFTAQHQPPVSKPDSASPSPSKTSAAIDQSQVAHGIAFRPRRPPHYSWAQTPDTLTVAFSLPVNISKAAIRIHFSLKGISLSLADSAEESAAPRIVELDANEEEQQSSQQTMYIGNDENDSQDPLQHAANLIRSGRYVSRALWGEIDPSGSVWTWERVVGHSGAYKDKPMGLLTLHLEKKYEGTRWMQVFADRRQSSGVAAAAAVGRSKWKEVSQKTKISFREAREKAAKVARGETDDVGEVQVEGIDEDEKEEEDEVPSFGVTAKQQEEEGGEEEEEDNDDDEDDVPETLDPSELINMLEGMEKYTVDEDAEGGGGRKSGDASTFGLDRTQFTDRPNLLNDGLEEEDENVGRPLVLSWVSADGGAIRVERPSKDAQESRAVLALPLATTDTETTKRAIAVKHDLDGAVFLPPATGKEWKHVDTLFALAFVLASKRDAHRVFIHHATSDGARTDAEKREGVNGYASAVLAFESAPQIGLKSASAASAGDAGNLFIYYSSSDRGGDNKKQDMVRVIRLGDGDGNGSGALLGVVAVPELEDGREGGKIVLCLCEREVLVLRNIL